MVLMLPLIGGAHAAREDSNKGHGAGGARGEHASEQGLESGKAWAGARDGQEQREKHEREREKAKKQEKQEKQKKETTH
jgi:hypothetical protein